MIVASVFGGSGNTTAVAGGRINTSVYYVPGIIALGVIAACFGNLAASVTAQRERGVLRRRRATPVPAVASALLVAYNPHTTGLGFAGLDLLIVAAWGAAGLLIAVRKFSWLPLGR